jgi:hypothetical protein
LSIIWLILLLSKLITIPFLFSFFKIDNGIPIVSYYDNQNDDELNDLAKYLKHIVELDDLREANK